jgi:hypothetical protein
MIIKKTKIQMEWRLSALMGARHIRTATELQRRLGDVGVSISSAQLTRLVNRNPARLSSNLMYGLTLVLDCEACDLWHNPDRPTPHEMERASRITQIPKPRLATMADAEEATQDISQDISKDTSRITGPKVTPFPKKGD